MRRLNYSSLRFNAEIDLIGTEFRYVHSQFILASTVFNKSPVFRRLALIRAEMDRTDVML